MRMEKPETQDLISDNCYVAAEIQFRQIYVQ